MSMEDINGLLQEISEELERRIKRYKSKRHRNESVRLLSEVDQTLESIKPLLDLGWGQCWSLK